MSLQKDANNFSPHKCHKSVVVLCLARVILLEIVIITTLTIKINLYVPVLFFEPKITYFNYQNFQIEHSKIFVSKQIWFVRYFLGLKGQNKMPLTKLVYFSKDFTTCYDADALFGTADVNILRKAEWYSPLH